jgi:hypothetical protein
MSERRYITNEACTKPIDELGAICGEPSNIIEQRTDPNSGLIFAVSECRAGHQFSASFDPETGGVYNRRWLA